MRRRSRLVALVLLVVAATAAGGGSAASASPLGFSLTPVGFSSYFTFDARPGQALTGSLGVVNETHTTKTIVLAPVDVSTAATGGLQYGEGAAKHDGRWLALATRRVKLSGGASATVRFTVRIPGGTAPGEHFIGISAVDSRALSSAPVGGRAVRLRLIPRLAMTVRLRLPGRRRTRLTAGRASISVTPSGASLVVGMSNQGNSLIAATPGTITVLQGAEPLFGQTVELAAFVPGTAISYHVPWEGTPVQGTYLVRGVLRPAGAPVVRFERTVTFGRAAIHRFRKQTGRAARESSSTPLALVVGLAVALVAAALLGVAFLRTRSQLRERVGR